MSGIVYTIEEAVEQTGWSKEKIIKNAQQGLYKIVIKHTYSIKDHLDPICDYIKQDEFNKLLELAGKPSITQLEATIQAQQEEIERLKAEIEALKSEPTTSEKPEHPNTLNKSKAIIKALYELADKPHYKEIIRQADLLGFSVSDDTISNRLK